jgi:hypothetical protein
LLQNFSLSVSFLSLREEYRMKVFENTVLRRIFGPKRDEIRGGWRILHNEELHDLYSSPNKIRIMKSRKMRWEGHEARMGGTEECMRSVSECTRREETTGNT